MNAPKRSLGQNFLMHPQIAERMVRAAALPPRSTVLEIGPGTGMLTRILLAEGYSVTAVEADGELVTGLEETFANEIREKRLTLVRGDIRTFDPSSLPKLYSLVANIPYYITGEIIRMFLTATHKPQSMTLLVQKEVAERITGRGQKKAGAQQKEGLLSLSVKAFGTPEFGFIVPRGAFRPAPNVDSAVFSIRDINSKAFKSPSEESFFFEVLRAGFAHKRKLLAGNLSPLFSPEKVAQAFEAANIPPKSRSEDLSLDDWQRLISGLK